MHALRSSEYQFVRDPHAPAQGDPEATFLQRLADGRVFRRLPRALASPWQREPERRRDDRDVPPAVEDHRITARAQDVDSIADGNSELGDGLCHEQPSSSTTRDGFGMP